MILGVIPARGGSKGIPHKNIKLLCAKPLIAWTIEAAKEAKLMDKFIVSTEDNEISRIAKEYGAEVLERPIKLATDKATTLSVLQDILKKITADIIVLLQPTSPIRNSGLIDYCIKKFQEADADSLATGFICKYYEWGTYDERRQDLKGYFYDDGNIYIYKAELLKRGDKFGKKREKIIIYREQNVEIDDEFDFWLAEQIIKNRLDNPKI